MRLFGVLLAGLVGVVALTPAAAAAERGDKSEPPPIFPKPQSVTPRDEFVVISPAATLVRGAATDPSALAVTRSVLRAAGVRWLREIDDQTDVGFSLLTVYVGGASENRATGGALAALGVADSAGLPSGGYVLAAGGSKIVLDGADATGTFYAAQTLRQIIHSGQRLLRGVAVRDWPSMPLRGVIEGFYGIPWTTADRLAQLDFYGQHKMNTYVYSPKDDPYLRANWRDEYPPDKLAELKTLVDRARANHVDFTYALSPGLSVCYSDPNDVKALSDKFQSLWDIGVRTFAIPLDDISYTQWNCDADREMFGTGPAAAGAAQSYLLNAVQRDFIATHPGSGRLEMVPTEYADVDSTPYKSVLAARLDPAVLVEWTGVGVIAPVITGAQADAAKQVFGHDILVWDNYPVNDYIPGQLLLGPYVGRDPGLPSLLVGITANPMAQAAASKVALFTVADYAWNSRGYDAQRSWNASLAELAGGNDATLSALTAFADVNYASPLDKTQAPELSPKITDFWRSWPDGVIRAALPLRRAFDQLHDAPAVLRASLPDKDFLAETSLWLDATQTWALAADTATDMLIAQWEGDLVRAWADRLAVIDLVRAARSISYVGLDGKKHPVLVGQGVIDTFVADALAENAKAFNAQRTALTPSTSMSAYQSYVPANMVDGDPATYYWSSRAVRTGDTVGVDLGSAEQVGDIVVLMSKSDSVDDYMHSGVVEHSVDGSEWTVARSFAGTQQVAFSPPASTTARHVRLRATADQPNWLVVREFTVTTSVVTGGPEPAPGSRLSAVVDGNVDSAYVAARAPSGETLTIALPAPLPVTRVVVLCSAGRGHVETGTNDVWSAIGDLGGGYTAFSLPGAPVDAIRLVWSPDSPAPVVHEVIAT